MPANFLNWISFDRFTFRLFLSVFAICFVIYLPSLNGPFILDDAHTVQTNISIQNPKNFFALWTSSKYYSSSPDNWGYRPVQAAFNLIAWQMGNGATWPFHLLKILFFAGTVTFFSLSWRRILPDYSTVVILLGTLWYAVNPVHTQVVSYIAATSTLIAGFCISFAMYQYLRFRVSGDWWRLFLSAAILFPAMLSKEEAVTSVALIPLLEGFLRWREKRLRIELRDIVILLPYVVSVGLGLLLWIYMQEPSGSLSRGTFDRWLYLATQFSAWLRYMAIFFVPYDLNADNLEFGFAMSWTEVRVWLSLIVNMLLLATSLFFVKRMPLLLFALIWFYIAVSPASSIMVLAEPVNDHRAFIAYLGYGALVFPIVHYLLQFGRKGLIVTAALLVGYSGFAMARNHTWSSNDLLWEDTIVKNPGSVRAHNNAALNYMHRAEWKRSAELLDRCLEIEPRYAYCLINRALVGISRGEEQLAESLFIRAIEADFAGVNARRYFAEYLISRGRLSEALPHLLAADKAVSGRSLTVRVLLVRVYVNIGQKADAQRIYDESLATFGPQPSLTALAASVKQ